MGAHTVHYFGYGSLVNRATRPAGEAAAAARLNGWRRTWNHRVPPSEARYGCTAVSIDPAPDAEGPGIDGVVVEIPLEALAALDAREANYDRLALPRERFSLPDSVTAETVFVYRSSEARRADADDAHPVLQSYVDCIMAGYLERFGPAGLDAWLASTDGWDTPIEDDRADPRYPRAVRLPDETLARFDALLEAHLGRPAALPRTDPAFPASAAGPSGRRPR